MKCRFIDFLVYFIGLFFELIPLWDLCIIFKSQDRNCEVELIA